MGKFALLVRGLYDDGLKAPSIFSPLLSIAFTVAKIFDAVPILRHVDYGWAFLPLTIWLLVAYVRRWSAFQDQIELPRAPPLSLTPMSAWDIAEYLLNKSVWGWHTYGELNFWKFVRNAVAEEMRRAGLAAEVRYIGTRPNEQTAEEINRTYWNFATIDDGRIWDRRNNFFSVQRGDLTPSVRGGVIHYQFGAAPRIDVLKTWPPASITMKMGLGLRVWLRQKRARLNPMVLRIMRGTTAALFLVVIGYCIRWIGWR
jgi:hypothetical protein